MGCQYFWENNNNNHVLFICCQNSFLATEILKRYSRVRAVIFLDDKLYIKKIKYLIITGLHCIGTAN